MRTRGALPRFDNAMPGPNHMAQAVAMQILSTFFAIRRLRGPQQFPVIIVLQLLESFIL